ncbi:hypothetical protein AVEN_235173-1 [Araneus ventricosus]|uniref:Uncharacterized protein n=1 Tax=Araneus ventricosus TaxID=182803 RepID=A0A4Y2JC46_ARAVE|nr:hypothetical protein AVEN_235173-1 [Araneus ventricosus]
MMRTTPDLPIHYPNFRTTRVGGLLAPYMCLMQKTHIHGGGRGPTYTFNTTAYPRTRSQEPPTYTEQNAVSLPVPVTRPVTERFDGQYTGILFKKKAKQNKQKEGNFCTMYSTGIFTFTLLVRKVFFSLDVVIPFFYLKGEMSGN